MPGPQMGAPGIAFRGSEDLAQKKHQQQQQKKKKTITVICTDPDATDSSGDEACGGVAVPAFKKKKRLVREIFLPLAIATASPVTENRHSSSFSPTSSSSSSSSSTASVVGATKQAAVMKPSRRQTKPLRRSSSKPKAAYRRGKCLPLEMEMPFAGESLESGAVFDRFSSEDDDAALLAFVSDIIPDDDVGNSHILHDSLPPSSSSSFSSSSSSSTEFFSPTGLISSQKPMDISLSMFEEGYCGPLAAELSQILDHMMIPTQELNRKLPDFVFDIFDPNNGAGGDLSDLNFDLDCESMAWVNIPEGCIV